MLKTHPISPVTGVVAICLAVEVVHDRKSPWGPGKNSQGGGQPFAVNKGVVVPRLVVTLEVRLIENDNGGVLEISRAR